MRHYETGNITYTQRDISPSQLGISSRQINYWIDQAIVPFVEKQQSIKLVESGNINKQNKTKWIRLNLAQAAWVCIVNELFKFKVPLETLRELAFKIWQQPRLNHYADSVIKGSVASNVRKNQIF